MAARETVAAVFLAAVAARAQTLGDHGLLIDDRIVVRREFNERVDQLARMTGKDRGGLLVRVERAAKVVHEEATLAARTFTL